jgi:hypothetical protein
MTPVIALARSDAIMTAASATSDSIGRRRSKVPLLASAKNFSGDPGGPGVMLEGLLDVWRVRRPGRPRDDEPDPVWSELRGETPLQPFDRAARDPEPPWWSTGVGATVMDMTTPDPCRTIRRAAARTVRNWSA